MDDTETMIIDVDDDFYDFLNSLEDTGRIRLYADGCPAIDTVMPSTVRLGPNARGTTYSPRFKVDVVRWIDVANVSVGEAAERLDVSRATLYNWQRTPYCHMEDPRRDDGFRRETGRWVHAARKRGLTYKVIGDACGYDGHYVARMVREGTL